MSQYTYKYKNLHVDVIFPEGTLPIYNKEEEDKKVKELMLEYNKLLKQESEEDAFPA